MSFSDKAAIQKATNKDIDEIFRIEKISFEEDAFSKQQFSYLINRANGSFVLVKQNDKIMGYLILLYRKNSKQVRIYSLAVVPEARGLGLGKMLLEYAENEAKERGRNSISLEVSERNESAIQLYKRNGYHIKTKRANYYADGTDAHIMIKEI